MAKFEFSKKTTTLEICNKTYTIEDDKKLDKKLVDFGEFMKEKANGIPQKADYTYYKKITTDFCNDCYKFIDSLLGVNSSEEIFKDRMYDIEDCFSLLDFIREELETQRAQRMKKYSNSRIQRDQVKQNFKKRR